MQTYMPAVPVYDAREGGLLAYAAARRDAARGLRDGCFAPAPAFLATPVLKAADAISMRWLNRSASPYAQDVEALSHVLGFAGVPSINMGYQFGCTTGASPGSDGVPLMRRVLDWPLHGLGRAIEVVKMRGAAGDYLNVTWPGAAGVLTATAPGRFCAAINQAPLHRRTAGSVLRLADMARHLRNTLRDQTGWPPDHLLRYAFETCRTFEDAVKLLCREPVARPVIYSIAGTREHEMALIERDGKTARLFRGAFATANDWQHSHPRWEPRGCASDKRRDNFERCELMRRAQVADARDFLWLAPPILNARTRLAVEMNALGELHVQGYERARGDKTASAATQTLTTLPALV